MKTMKHVSFITVILLTVLSCSNPLGDNDSTKMSDEENLLKLNFTFATGRTIAPSQEDLMIDAYRIVLTRRGYADISATAESTAGEEGFLLEDIALGVWTVTVEALGVDGSAIASGSTSVEVATGLNNVDVALSYNQTNGKGGLSLTLRLPTYLISSFDESQPGLPMYDQRNPLYDLKGNLMGVAKPSGIQAGLVYPDGSVSPLSTTLLSAKEGMSTIAVGGIQLKAGSPILHIDSIVYGELQPLIMESVWIYGNVVTTDTRTILPGKPASVDLLYESEDDFFLQWIEVSSAYGYRIYAREVVDGTPVGEALFLLDITVEVLNKNDFYIPDSITGSYELDYFFIINELNAKLDPFTEYLFGISAHCGVYESEITFMEEGTYTPVEWARLNIVESSSAAIEWWEVSGATEYKIYIESQNPEVSILKIPLGSADIQSLEYVMINDKKRYYYDFIVELMDPDVKENYYGNPEVFISFTVDGVESGLLSAGTFNFSSGW